MIVDGRSRMIPAMPFITYTEGMNRPENGKVNLYITGCELRHRFLLVLHVVLKTETYTEIYHKQIDTVDTYQQSRGIYQQHHEAFPQSCAIE
jgi:hypothetical protein